MFVIAQTLSGLFVRIFTAAPAHIEMATWMIRTYTLGVIGLAIQYPFVDGMTGMGLVKWGLTFSMLRKGVFFAGVFILPRAVRRNRSALCGADLGYPVRGALGRGISDPVPQADAPPGGGGQIKDGRG